MRKLITQAVLATATSIGPGSNTHLAPTQHQALAQGLGDDASEVPSLTGEGSGQEKKPEINIRGVVKKKKQ
jgi:hypothetical protein